MNSDVTPGFQLQALRVSSGRLFLSLSATSPAWRRVSSRSARWPSLCSHMRRSCSDVALPRQMLGTFNPPSFSFRRWIGRPAPSTRLLRGLCCVQELHEKKKKGKLKGVASYVQVLRFRRHSLTSNVTPDVMNLSIDLDWIFFFSFSTFFNQQWQIFRFAIFSLF